MTCVRFLRFAMQSIASVEMTKTVSILELVLMRNGNGYGVIFDLDGVLIDTCEFHKQSFYDLAEKEEGFHMSDEFFYDKFGMQNGQIIPAMTDRQLSEDEIEQLSQWKEQRYRELIKGKLQLLDGAAELIEELHNNGFKLAIGTSTPRVNLEFTLDIISARDKFDAHVTGEDVSKGKPAPDTFLKAAEKLDLEPKRCVVIEDAIAGVEAAKNAGMTAFAVTTTRPSEDLVKADLIVNSLKELKAADFLDRLNRGSQ